MNADALPKRAKALIKELTRYCAKHGERADSSHVRHLEDLLQEEMEAHISACQRTAALRPPAPSLRVAHERYLRGLTDF